MVAIHLVENGAHPHLGLPRCRCPCVEVGNVVAGLVTMNVAAYKTLGCDVLIVFIILLRQVHNEQRVELLQEVLVATKQRDESHNILRSREREVP